MPNLREYGGRIITVNGQRIVELRDPNDNARRRFQYRRNGAGITKRVLSADGQTLIDWQDMTPGDVACLHSIRGAFHPVLDPLGF